MTTVLTKMSPNGKITLYMPGREFVDDLTCTQPIDGVVVIDPKYLGPQRIFAVQLMAVCRYGREEDEVMGLMYAKEFCLASVIVDKCQPLDRLTAVQKDVMSLHPEGCFPFHIEWPRGMATDMFIEQRENAMGRPIGMRYYLEVFSMLMGDNQTHRRSTIHFDVSLIQKPAEALRAFEGKPVKSVSSVNRSVLLGCGQVQMDVVVEKTFITDGEPIVLHVTLANHSGREIKKVKATLVQSYGISFSSGRRKLNVVSVESSDGFPVGPGGSLSRSLILHPRVPFEKLEGIAVRGNGEKKSLAPSTFFDDAAHPDTFGFIVSYMVKVKVVMQPTALKCGVETTVPVYLVTKPCNSMKTFGEVRTRALGVC